MVNTLFIEAIGFYNIPIASFFVLEIKEVVSIMTKIKERIEFDHRLQYIAFQNVIGKSFGKNYKYYDVFESREPIKKEVTEEEKEELKAYFDSWE